MPGHPLRQSAPPSTYEAPPSGTSRTTLWRQRKRQERARALNMEKIEVRVRIEAATKALSEGKDPIRILTSQAFPLPNKEMALPLKPAQAYVYLMRARQELAKYIQRQKEDLAADALAVMNQAIQIALDKKDARAVIVALDYRNFQLGLPNKITATRTLKLQAEAPKEATKFTDEQLEQIIEAESQKALQAAKPVDVTVVGE